VDNAAVLHVFEALNNLPGNIFQLLLAKNRVFSFIELCVFIQVVAKAFENYYHVLAEFEVVQ